MMLILCYNDAVEEALWFGWIDSTVKALDNNNTIQRFTPRNPKCDYSQANKDRLQWLFDKKMIFPSLEEIVKHTINYKFLPHSDIIERIKKDKAAWENYQRFSDSYQRIRIAILTVPVTDQLSLENGFPTLLIKHEKINSLKVLEE